MKFSKSAKRVNVPVPLTTTDEKEDSLYDMEDTTRARYQEIPRHDVNIYTVCYSKTTRTPTTTYIACGHNMV
jgi:hypothetical protein